MMKALKPFLACLSTGALLLLLVAEARAVTFLDPVEGQKEAKELVGKLLSLQPTENATNYGILKIIPKDKSKRVEIPVEFTVKVTATNWLSIYKTLPTNGHDDYTLIVAHNEGNTNHWRRPNAGLSRGPDTSFAGSDFSAEDLGLTFLHWPAQRIVKKEIKRSCGCSVLESLNPDPNSKGYSKVLTWIDNDSLGVVQAEAYDVKGDEVKEFIPKSVTKVNGQWQVEEIEMDNVQTKSRTLITFDLSR